LQLRLGGREFLGPHRGFLGEKMRQLLTAVVFLGLIWPATVTQESTSLAASQRNQNGSLSVGQNEGTFLILSDLHFDPFADLDPKTFGRLNSRPVQDWPAIFKSSDAQKISADGMDSNYTLLVSALDAAKGSRLQYDYVLVMGDYLTHNFPQKYRAYRPDGKGYQEFVIKTFAFVSQMIQGAFPSIPVYSALGNNDSLIGDYSPPGDALLAALAKEWKTIARDREISRTFRAGGYYAVPHPTVRSSEFIILNTAFLSQRYDTPSIINGDQGAAELDWLDSQLTQLSAKQQTAVLIMHIPPGIDGFASSRAGNCSKPTLFWKRPYLDSFLAIIKRHENILRDAYAGHLHTDDVRIFTDASGRPFLQLHIAPSISRDHRNNPEFEIGAYDKNSGALLDYELASLKDKSNTPGETAQPQWGFAYDFQQESGTPYSPQALMTLSDIIRSSAVLRKRFVDLYAAQASGGAPVNAGNWRFYSCAETEMTPEDFNSCACSATDRIP
jgi:sphingomyelin phosphodiesterase acid-like 3